MQVILLGPPGSGKGTQASRLAQRLGLEHISPGTILRDEAQRESPIGRRLRTTMAAGELVADELIDELVSRQLQRLPASQGFVLDGYPRTAAQARALRRTLACQRRLRRRPLVAWLQVPREVLIRRLRARSRTESRPDDSEAAIRRRLRVDHDHARELRDALAGWTDIVTIDADQPADYVTAQILEALSRLDRRPVA